MSGTLRTCARVSVATVLIMYNLNLVVPMYGYLPGVDPLILAGENLNSTKSSERVKNISKYRLLEGSIATDRGVRGK